MFLRYFPLVNGLQFRDLCYYQYLKSTKHVTLMRHIHVRYQDRLAGYFKKTPRERQKVVRFKNIEVGLKSIVVE